MNFLAQLVHIKNNSPLLCLLLLTETGYPIATLPLSYLKLNGRPFGVAAVSAAHNEALLIQLMSAWEVAFPERRVPTELNGPNLAAKSEL